MLSLDAAALDPANAERKENAVTRTWEALSEWSMRGNDGEHTQAEQNEHEVYSRPPTDGL